MNNKLSKMGTLVGKGNLTEADKQDFLISSYRMSKHMLNKKIHKINANRSRKIDERHKKDIRELLKNYSLTPFED